MDTLLTYMVITDRDRPCGRNGLDQVVPAGVLVGGASIALRYYGLQIPVLSSVDYSCN